ncbi:MAG: hypothetical protein A2494_03160 [Candidatus Lloydbacteria bacterium RIFOXYC12_FULL_46_25]|uniref:Uncharacterized protein n=1 Tax=Candidatus Lloydbacteria bacterium RIFOXYC12_FULL_46_25 TaxID=1798670 RepID=A0A1G2DUH7_9BACT|nr:MAG: hypothetical protein A2494_03160 [Candidatus Lloydbacteria bacterium RIFOXYC12_FULL_46_25]
MGKQNYNEFGEVYSGSFDLEQAEIFIKKQYGNLFEIKNEIINIRACNYPYLVERLIISILDNIQKYHVRREKIIINIINDTKKKGTAKTFNTLTTRLNSIAPEYVDIHIYHIHDRNRILEQIERLSPKVFPKEEFVAFISQEFKNVGGTIGAFNYSLLMSQYSIGKYNFEPKQTVCTFHDDDIHYSILDENGGKYVVDDFDFFKERELLFSLPNSQVVSGRVTHHTGSPYKMFRDFASTLLSLSSLLGQDRFTPFSTFDNEQSTTIENPEMLDKSVETILQSFIDRKPILNLYSRNRNNGTSANTFTINGGSFSMRATEINKLLVLPFSLQDLVLTAQVKSKFGIDAIKIATGPRHIRRKKNTDVAASPSHIVEALLRDNDPQIYNCLVKLSHHKGLSFGKFLKDISQKRTGEIKSDIEKVKTTINRLGTPETSHTKEILLDSLNEILSFEKALNNMTSYESSAETENKTNDLLEIFTSIEPKTEQIHGLFRELGTYDYLGNEYEKIRNSIKNKKFIILSFDLDGTLRESVHSPLALKATQIQRYVKGINSNFITVLNTNNSIGQAKEINTSLKFDYILAENGAVLYDTASGKQKILAPKKYLENLRELKEFLAEKKISIFHERDGTLYIRDGYKFNILKDSMTEVDWTIFNLNYYFTDTHELKVVVNPQRGSKFTGLQLLKKKYGKQVLSVHIGDDEFDVPDMHMENHLSVGVQNHKLNSSSRKKFDKVLPAPMIEGVMHLLNEIEYIQRYA